VPDYRDALIAHYAAHPVADIHNVATFQALLRQNTDNDNFGAERNRIEIAKKSIETALKGQLTEQETVQKAIQLLITLRSDPKRRDLCYELFVAGYLPKWTDARRRQYFEAAWKKVQLEYDYFISFTTRYPNPDTPGGNPVNNDHKYFIISKIGRAEFNKARRKADNLLADAIDRTLAQPGMKRFFFPVYQYDNSETEKKLQYACDNCMAFFQLVQPIMFTYEDGVKNYSFIEWKRVFDRLSGSEDAERNILFVVVLPSRNAFFQIRPHPDYTDWHQKVSIKDPYYLPESSAYDVAIVAETNKFFKEKLVPKICGAWDRLVEAVP
jgi:hypothetical protein